MAEVSLAKALKLKNRAVKQVQELQKQLQSFNSRVVGSDVPFDIRSKFTELEDAIRNLAEIKAAIQKANAPIQEKIFLMAELRGQISFLSNLNTQSGQQLAGFGGTTLNYEVSISAAEAYEARARIEAELDELQDSVDAFNASTLVTIP